MLEQARAFATIAHEGQRYGNEPYTYHLGKVVEVLRRFDIDDPDLLAAGWLHDTLEDTPVEVDDLRNQFNDRVAALVDAVTDGQGATRKDRKQRPYRLIPRTPGAVYLKLADRIANLEASLDEGHDRLLKRYAHEHWDFHKRLFDGVTALPMWEHLDNIFMLGGCGRVSPPYRG